MKKQVLNVHTNETRTLLANEAVYDGRSTFDVFVFADGKKLTRWAAIPGNPDDFWNHWVFV